VEARQSSGDGDGRKQRRRKTKNDDCTGFIGRPGSKEKPRRSLSQASAKPRAATVASGSRRKIVDGELASAVTVHQNYQTAIRFKNPNYSQIYVTTQKSQKKKLFQI
jgi:hypothetical protein